jgi:hypothetical protein
MTGLASVSEPMRTDRSAERFRGRERWSAACES